MWNRDLLKGRFYIKQIIGGTFSMKKSFGFECQDDKDILHHYLEEQIAYISVQEEEERMREDIQKGADM